MKSIQAICFIILTTLTVNAQTPKKAVIEEQLLQRVVPRDGWTTPVFADQVINIVDKLIEIDDIEVQSRTHYFAKQMIVFAEHCNTDIDKKLIQEGRKWDSLINGFVSYEVKGKIFAYVTSNALVDTENGYVKVRVGASTRFVYVDEDGDGKFELRCKTIQLKSLPEWVKTLSAK